MRDRSQEEEEKERENEAKWIFEETMDNSFPKIKENSTQNHGVQKGQRGINERKAQWDQSHSNFWKQKIKIKSWKDPKGKKIDILHKGDNAVNRGTFFITNRQIK